MQNGRTAIYVTKYFKDLYQTEAYTNPKYLSNTSKIYYGFKMEEMLISCTLNDASAQQKIFPYFSILFMEIVLNLILIRQ